MRVADARVSEAIDADLADGAGARAEVEAACAALAGLRASLRSLSHTSHVYAFWWKRLCAAGAWELDVFDLGSCYGCRCVYAGRGVIAQLSCGRDDVDLDMLLRGVETALAAGIAAQTNEGGLVYCVPGVVETRCFGSILMTMMSSCEASRKIRCRKKGMVNATGSW